MRPNSKEQLVGNCKNRRTLSSQNRHSSSNRLIGIFDEPRPVLDLSLQHPLMKRRGGCAIRKKNPFRSGADGWSLTRHVRRTDHPVRALQRRLRGTFLTARPPLLDQEGNNTFRKCFRRTGYLRESAHFEKTHQGG